MLTEFKVKTISYHNGEYRLGKAVPVIDEGSFYRIGDSHIFDKYRICGIYKNDKMITLMMKDQDVVLFVE